MFEKYDINDLFLAQISARYPQVNTPEVNIGNMFYGSTIGYGYLSIILKRGENFYDLNDSFKKLLTKDEPRQTTEITHQIEYMEPLSNYYTQDGKKKNVINKKQAKAEAQKYCDTFRQNYYAYIRSMETAMQAVTEECMQPIKSLLASIRGRASLQQDHE